MQQCFELPFLVINKPKVFTLSLTTSQVYAQSTHISLLARISSYIALLRH